MDSPSNTASPQGSPSRAHEEPLIVNSHRERNPSMDSPSSTAPPQASVNQELEHEYPLGALSPQGGNTDTESSSSPATLQGSPNQQIERLNTPSPPHPSDIITIPSFPFSNNQLRIIPLTRSNTIDMHVFHAGKHHFLYNPHLNTYAYKGQIPFLVTRAKQERLYDLLADYMHDLLADIGVRRGLDVKFASGIMTPVDWNQRSQIIEARQEFERWRGRARVLNWEGFARDLVKDLKIWYDERERRKYERRRYYEYFLAMREENVWEMFALLMDEGCREIRERWDEVFAAHVVGTDGVADIFENVDFEERWKKRNDVECAWRWLREGGRGRGRGEEYEEEYEEEGYEEEEYEEYEEEYEGEYEGEYEEEYEEGEDSDGGEKIGEERNRVRSSTSVRVTTTKTKGEEKKVEGSEPTGREPSGKRKTPPCELTENTHPMVTRKKVKRQMPVE
ncbi:hypothetical protein N431DRAFT_462509 [Stipitochalara longipes BDJ]|nr:hypothetical protein N431DRAFT_462509 [Stipitochalara longipes BDJ]